MRTLALLLLLAGAVPPAFSAKQIAVDKVDQLLIHSRGKSDAKVAKQLFNMALTERVSSARFAPDRAAQDALLRCARNYVANTIHKLPNFFATRDTTRFSDEPENVESLTLVNYQYRQLHLVGISSDKVYFRAGKEVVVANTTKHVSPSERPLVTEGVFGEVMELILTDILSSSPVWSHWEDGGDAPLAVFRYAVPLERSHYAVAIPDASGTPPHVAYHGEIAIDRANGTVLRLTIVAELSWSGRISRAEVMVEYGPVEIGGTRYICPVKSVSLTVTRNVAPAFQYKLSPDATNAGSPQAYANDLQLSPDSTPATPPIISLNDVRFRQYHRFRVKIRILTGGNAKSDRNPPASTPPPTNIEPRAYALLGLYEAFSETQLYAYRTGSDVLR